MTFDDVLDQVREWIGVEVAVVLTLTEFGPGEGWLIDTAGRLARIDDPIPAVDQPVHYVRFESGHGFALERTWFRSAEWTEIAGQRDLNVDFGAVTLTIAPTTA